MAEVNTSHGPWPYIFVFFSGLALGTVGTFYSVDHKVQAVMEDRDELRRANEVLTEKLTEADKLREEEVAKAKSERRVIYAKSPEAKAWGDMPIPEPIANRLQRAAIANDRPETSRRAKDSK